MKSRIYALILPLIILFAFPVFALDLQAARESGVVGEKLDGYVAVLKSSPDVEDLVKEVNAKRKEEYTRIAKEKNQSVEVVAKLASVQIIKNLKSGAFYQSSGGSWQQK